MHPRVAIIYLCHGNLRHLPEVVSSLAALDFPHDRLSVMMIPNGSPDGITKEIQEKVLPRSKKDLPEIILHDDGVNHGFATANNIGIRWAIQNNFDYVFLHNGDLHLHPGAITEAVALAQSDLRIGSVQSLVTYWHDHQKVNVSGGMIHVAGYGFARDNGRLLADLNYDNGAEINYASGAAVVYRVSALKEVGLLEEGFQMYHEDLELGLRLRLSGYRNALCTKSLAYHDYSFSRNPKKFAWMELYRWVVVKSYFKFFTLFLLLPLLLAIEAGTWMMALRGGWLKAKLWAFGQWFNPATWKLLFAMRRRVKRLRKISDQELLRLFTGSIEAQETSNSWMDKVINPAVEQAWQAAYKLIRW